MYSDRLLIDSSDTPGVHALPITASMGLVSHRHVFSDCLCRATEAELPDVEVVRFNEFHDVLAAQPEWRDHLRLIVLDEAAAETLDVVQARWLTRHSGARFACAYSDLARAKRILCQNTYPDPLGSLFPLNIGLDGWISVLKLCLTGHPYVSPELLARPATAVQADARQDGQLSSLTPRETEVLELVADGCQNKEIAARLELSENTVKLHIRNIISKLGVHNRTEAAMIHAHHRQH